MRGTERPTYYGANTLGAQAGYEIDLWGRVHNAVRAGSAEAQASAADLETVRLMLHAELADDYVALRGLDEEAKLLADTVATYDQAYQLTHNLFEGKIASLIDVTRAETQLHDAEAQVSDITRPPAPCWKHAIATPDRQIARGVDHRPGDRAHRRSERTARPALHPAAAAARHRLGRAACGGGQCAYRHRQGRVLPPTFPWARRRAIRPLISTW